MSSMACKICGAATAAAGRKYGTYAKQWYDLRHCPVCHFSFVDKPWTEYEKIYSEAYYHGCGADPFVDYVFELEHPHETIRQYEWSGILHLVQSLADIGSQTQWLDFGCGNGGLVRYLREHTESQIVGFDEGWISDRAMEKGIPYLDKAALATSDARFDIVTAIEVLEHVVDPLEILRLIRHVLKPGGLFFLTTGNAQPFRNRLSVWQYVIPEIHVSFYEPETLMRALQQTGFRTEQHGMLPGFANIIRFKVLKTLHRRRQAFYERMLPWSIVSRIIDARMHMTAHPLGWAAEQSTVEPQTQ